MYVINDVDQNLPSHIYHCLLALFQNPAVGPTTVKPVTPSTEVALVTYPMTTVHSSAVDPTTVQLELSMTKAASVTERMTLPQNPTVGPTTVQPGSSTTKAASVSDTITTPSHSTQSLSVRVTTTQSRYPIWFVHIQNTALETRAYILLHSMYYIHTIELQFFWIMRGLWGLPISSVIPDMSHHIIFVFENKIANTFLHMLTLERQVVGGYHPFVVPCIIFGDSNCGNCFILYLVITYGRHVLAYVTSSWRCHDGIYSNGPWSKYSVLALHVNQTWILAVSRSWISETNPSADRKRQKSNSFLYDLSYNWLYAWYRLDLGGFFL